MVKPCLELVGRADRVDRAGQEVPAVQAIPVTKDAAAFRERVLVPKDRLAIRGHLEPMVCPERSRFNKSALVRTSPRVTCAITK
jgi:hypothetical protein